MTFSSITVQWGAVDCIHRNGNITGYSVRYGVQGSGSAQIKDDIGAGATMTIISGLESSTNYSIEVAAVKNADTGIYSTSTTLETDGKSCCIAVAGLIDYYMDVYIYIHVREMKNMYMFIHVDILWVKIIIQYTHVIEERLGDCESSFTLFSQQMYCLWLLSPNPPPL